MGQGGRRGESDPYSASLQGKLVDCISLQDATAFKIADAILGDESGYEDFTPTDLERIAGVLLRYGRDEAARSLNSRAARIRAARYLSEAHSPRGIRF
jgi:hypothetical protein